MNQTTHATLIATVNLNGLRPEVLQMRVGDLLRELGVDLIPCGWAPDMGTVSECSDVDYDAMTLLDLNPNLVR